MIGLLSFHKPSIKVLHLILVLLPILKIGFFLSHAEVQLQLHSVNK